MREAVRPGILIARSRHNGSVDEAPFSPLSLKRGGGAALEKERTPVLSYSVFVLSPG